MGKVKPMRMLNQTLYRRMAWAVFVIALAMVCQRFLP